MNWRQMVLDTGRALMDIARTNRVILGRYREELDELRAFRLAAMATEREMRDEIDVLYALAADEGKRVGELSRKVAKLEGKHDDMAKSLGERVDDLESFGSAKELSLSLTSLWSGVSADRFAAADMDRRVSGINCRGIISDRTAVNTRNRVALGESSHVKLGDTVIALGEQMRRADDTAKVRLDALEATAKAIEAALAADRGRE